MTRRTFLASAAAGGVPPKPNIVIFLADDHGWNIAGCYGNRVVKTPNLDRFATEGLRFTAMFAGSPTCSPSRAILYTGLHSARNGLMGNHSGCRAGVKSIAHY
ncbi:MAG: hypothetical protein FJW30_26905, partial [Acidobacteria bacterium]|nr:hypothetical protein [Acidobacteriota bacterium]